MEQQRQSATFKQETMVKLLQAHFSEEKTKVSGDAAKLAVEVVRIFVKEGGLRAAMRAQAEGNDIVTVEHFEKILPQLMLDFM